MTTSKPSFIGLLNAIAVGEAAAEPLFNNWAAVTDDEALASTLRCVGMREGEHAKAFAKRMLELGFEVRWPEQAGPEPQRMETVCSTEYSDLTKFETLGFGHVQMDTDIFDTMFADKTIDPLTGGLLGRYIAEERDSVRILAADYQRLKAIDDAAKAAAAAKAEAEAEAAAKAEEPATPKRAKSTKASESKAPKAKCAAKPAGKPTKKAGTKK